MNDHEQHVKGWYASVCAALRQAELKAPETACIHCRMMRKVHVYNPPLCSISALATHFLAVNHDEVERMKAKQLALENLAQVCGWIIP